MSEPVDVKAIGAALAREFRPGEVKLKPQLVKGRRALAVSFVDARVVMDRLDEVLGVGGWQDGYQVLPSGSVVCRLTIHLGENWITREDVGSPSEQPDEGDQLKAAFSDGLKRAAVKFGVGRYLYQLKARWLDYDPERKQFVAQHAQEPQAEQSKAGVASEKDEVGDWIDWLGKKPNLEQINETLPILGDVRGTDARRRVWRLLCTYAQAQGWTFDQQAKRFVGRAA